MQPVRLTSGPVMREGGGGTSSSVQISIYQGNTYREDLSWLHFNDKPKVQEGQQVMD